MKSSPLTALFQDTRETGHSPEDALGTGRVLACSGCRRPVTTGAARIEIAGAHAHTVRNPHGLTFHIGCFREARGLIASGAPSDFFTWFPGYAWQVEHCESCAAHLGWLFRAGREAFHGLILTRLVEVPAAG